MGGSSSTLTKEDAVEIPKRSKLSNNSATTKRLAQIYSDIDKEVVSGSTECSFRNGYLSKSVKSALRKEGYTITYGGCCCEETIISWDE